MFTTPCHKKIDQKLKELAEKEESVTSKDGVLLPSPNWAALFTFIDSASHFAAESVTLRHLVD